MSNRLTADPAARRVVPKVQKKTSLSLNCSPTVSLLIASKSGIIGKREASKYSLSVNMTGNKDAKLIETGSSLPIPIYELFSQNSNENAPFRS